MLPYVYQGAVEHFAWLSPVQMIDGLALGETTPGPLIMVVAFVGFVGGYGKAVFGPDNLFLAGAVAATVVTWFYLLPSFLFILAGGPLVESTHNDLKFTGPLTAITAAVVGVILNLALFFAYHVLWPKGIAGAFDWVSAGIALAAAVALFRYKRSVIEVIVCLRCSVLLFDLLRAEAQRLHHSRRLPRPRAGQPSGVLMVERTLPLVPSKSTSKTGPVRPSRHRSATPTPARPGPCSKWSSPGRKGRGCGITSSRLMPG